MIRPNRFLSDWNRFLFGLHQHVFDACATLRDESGRLLVNVTARNVISNPFFFFFFKQFESVLLVKKKRACLEIGGKSGKTKYNLNI